MLPATGLYGHIANNNLRSMVLLAGFLGLLEVLYFSQLIFQLGTGLGVSASWGDTISLSRALSQLSRAGQIFGQMWDTTIVGGFIWFAVAFFSYARIIRADTGARPIERREEKRLYDIVEWLAIAEGLPMPRIEIMETPALNAYAAGYGPSDASIAVTRGLLDTLSDDELEGVIAHEIAHIRNRDVRLMLAATISVGIVQRAVRPLTQPLVLIFAFFALTSVVMALNLAFIIAMSLIVAGSALFLRFGISRAREFIADANAVELTKKPGALISALRKIALNDGLPIASLTTQAMMISNSMQGWFATHPLMEERIAALLKYAGTLIPSEDPAPVAAHMPALTPHSLSRGSPVTGQTAFGRRQSSARPSQS